MLKNYLNKQTEAAPLAVFRIFFGLLMFVSLVRFYINGWIEKLYLEPKFFFSYYGLEWIKPIGNWTYLIFIICAISSLLIVFGYRYRLAMLTFFLSFTYIELMDKTTYLNHYYFVSLLSLLLLFLPANVYFSLDARINKNLRFQKIPIWSVDAIKFLLVIVYFYAGLAKLNSDWLLEAMPLKIWLPAKYNIPLLGNWLQEEYMAYLFSWAGVLYDLTIPFLLLYYRTRLFAFALVVVFHLLTRVLFPIGMFPYIMILSTLIFFSPAIHRQILGFIAHLFKIQKTVFDNGRNLLLTPWKRKWTIGILSLFFIFQILLPFRYVCYPGELFWTEQGYRFSWRVMLMEKIGYANFKIVEQETGKRFYVNNADFLTPFQEKQMATQPDFILEYAHFLAGHYSKQGIQKPQVYVESYVALNGRGSQPFIDPTIDLTKVNPSFTHKNWILPFHDTINGF